MSTTLSGRTSSGRQSATATGTATGTGTATATTSTNAPSSTSSASEATVTVSSPPSSDSSTPGGGAIAGIVIGCVAFVSLVVLGLFFIYRRRSLKKQSTANTTDEPAMADPKTTQYPPTAQELDSEARDPRNPNHGALVEADNGRPIYELEGRETPQPQQSEMPATGNTANNTK